MRPATTSSLAARLRVGTALAALLASAPAMAQTLPDPVADPSAVRVGTTSLASFDVKTSTAAGEPTKTLTVTLETPTGRSVLDWRSFDIGETELAHFTTGGTSPASAAVLNRVSGAEFDGAGVVRSQMLGQLTSDAGIAVYLTNPSGILFGPKSSVSVGSLIASTRELSEFGFLAFGTAGSATDGVTGGLRFTGSSAGAIEVRAGAGKFEAIDPARGIVALIGARIDTARAITAPGEVVVVAANDTTIRYDSQSPLSVTIAEGTALGNPILVRGALTGGSVILATAATRTDVTAALLDVDASLIATGAAQTDRGIVLAAGPTGSHADTINIATTTPRGGIALTAGAVSLRLAGTLTANGGGVDARARTAILAGSAPATVKANDSVIATADGGGVELGALTATTGTLTATAGAGDLKVGGAVSQGDQRLYASGGVTSSGALSSIGGDLDVDGDTIAIGDARAGGDLRLASAGGALSAGRVTAGGLADVIAESDASVQGLSAGTDARLNGDGIVTLAGGGVVGGDLTVAGTAVRLGGASGEQQVGGSARYTARAGAITSAGSGLSIRADTNSAATTRGEIRLDARDGIILPGIALATGAAASTATGDVVVRLPGGATPLTLGAIDARALVGADAGNGSITLGDTRLSQSLALATSGAVDLAGITITGAGQALSVSGATVTASGSLSAPGTAAQPGGVAVSAAGPIVVEDIAAGAGAARLQSSSATIQAGAVSGASVSATAFGSLKLGDVTASGGPAMLVGVTGSLTAGDVSATGSVTLDSSGVIRAGDVLSSGGAVLFRSSFATATGGIQAGAVRARDSLFIDRPGAITLAGAKSDRGAVAITSGRAVTVGGAVEAATSVTVSGADAIGPGVSLGLAKAGTSTTLTATSGGLRVGGATQAMGRVTLDAAGTIVVGDVTSSGDTLVVRPAAVPASSTFTAGAVTTQTDLALDRSAGMTLASASSTLGAVSLSSSAGAVAVVGPVSAGTSVAVDAVSASLGTVEAKGGAASLTARGGPLNGLAVTASGDVTGNAATAIALAGVAAGGQATLRSGSGRIDVAGAVAGTRVLADAGSGLALGSVGATGTGDSMLRARGGSLGVAGPVSAVGGITAQATGGDVRLASIASSGGSVLIAADGGGVTAGSASARAALSADASGALSLGSASAGGSASLAGRSVALGTVDAGTLATTARDGALALTSGDVRGAVTLTQADASGRSDIGRLIAAGAVTIDGEGPVAVTGVLSSGGEISVSGSGVTLGSVSASGAGASLLRARAGSLDVGGAVTTVGALTATATGNVGLKAVTASAGPVTIVSGGAVSATSVDAGGAVAVDASDALGIGTVAARGGSATLVSSGGGATVGSLLAREALAADAAGALSIGSAGVGGPAVAIGRSVALGTVAASSLSATARDGALALGSGDVRGAVTLTQSGAGGRTDVGRLVADGAVAIAGDGPVALPGRLSSGGDLSVSGSGVTLGSAGEAVAQTAAGALRVTAGTGGIAGLSGLTLRSDTAGAGGRDLSLQSAAAITFAGDTLVAGGADRQSAVRLGAGSGAPIVLGTVEARTLAGPGDATAFGHDGAVTIGRLATRDGVAIALAGLNALALGPVEVRAGDLSLVSGGTLRTGSISAASGAVTLAGESVTTGAATTRSFAATARSGGADLGVVDAAGGGATVTTAGGIRLARATATGPVVVTSSGGDIGGSAPANGGLAPVSLTSSGSTVTVRGGTGAVLLGAVSGTGGVDVAGRTVTAESLASSAGAVSASTRGDGAAVLDQRLTLGSVDAAGTITLATGNAAAASNGALALDRATSTRGSIAVTTRGGGLAARDGSPRTVLQAPNGTVALAIDGAANLASANAGSVTIAAASIDAATLGASAGPLIAAAAGDARFGTVQGAGDTRLTAGRLVSAGTAAAGGALALDGATVDVRTASGASLTAVAGTGGLVLDSGTANGLAMLRSAGGARLGTVEGGSVAVTAAGNLAAIRLAARSGSVGVTADRGLTLGSAAASGDVSLASTGAATITGPIAAGAAYRIDADSITLGTTGIASTQSGGDVALAARTGAIAIQGATGLNGARLVALTASGAGGALVLAPETSVSAGTDATFVTRGAASLGTVRAGGAVRLDAIDAALTRPVTAQAMTLTNVATTGTTRIGDTAVGNEPEFAAGTARFDLSNAEAGLIAAPAVTIAGGARDVVVGALGLNAATGTTRFAITTSGRIDLLGRLVAAGSTSGRTIAIGSAASGIAARTGVIRLAATQADGGRLLVDGAVVELNADRIGGGLDRDFLDAIGYRSVAGLGVDAVTRDYVARPTSTLYNASALGAAPYTDPVLVQAGTLRLTYGPYALFQNTGRPGEQSGIVLGSLGGARESGATLSLAAPGSGSNTFGLFGTIDGISSAAAALLGSEQVSLDPSISPVASRVNGCVIGSGAGCLNSSIAQPTLNLFDTSRAEIVRTADDLTLPFDPLIGTNNEALYLDSADDQPTCEGDKPCPTKP